MKPNVKHNKIRNTGILFELLVRQITSDVLESRQHGAAVRLMKEFFSPSTELGKELILYRAFFSVQNLSEQKAFQLLNLVSEQRKHLNQRTLDTQKYKLIREIKSNFNAVEFFSSRIPSYKVYASIYKIFNSTMTPQPQISSISELADSQFTIVEHLSGKYASKKLQEHSELSTMLRSQENDVRYLSYKFLVERFNKKYTNLDASQKKLLQEYIYNISNTSKMSDYVQDESSKLAMALQTKIASVTNTVTKIKLAEVISQLKKLKTVKTVKENHLTALLIGYEILKEVDAL